MADNGAFTRGQYSTVRLARNKFDRKVAPVPPIFQSETVAAAVVLAPVACAHFRSTQLGSATASPAPTSRLPRHSCPGMSLTTGANTISSLMLDYYQEHAMTEALIEAIRIAAAGVGVGCVAWLRQEQSTDRGG
jgi:hypothetical protein